MNPLYQNDLNLLQQKSLERIMGIDEAGRGALAGPVVIAAVILDYSDPIIGLNDSKLLSVKKREALACQISSRALAFTIVELDATTIDEINIRQASLKGFVQVYNKLKKQTPYALVDGRDLPDEVQGQAVIKGDQKHAAIAAASILAKVHRDQVMRDLDLVYPEYDFATHKGYGTSAHYAALRCWGASPVHRRSFRLT